MEGIDQKLSLWYPLFLIVMGSALLGFSKQEVQAGSHVCTVGLFRHALGSMK